MRFREARERAGLSVTEVAHHIGVSKQAVWQWEKGDKNPSIDKLAPLATLYGCSVDDLLQEQTGVIVSKPQKQ